MSNFDHFNWISPIYDRIFGRLEDKVIVDLCEVEPGHNLLDVGGGTGRVSILFKKIINQVFIVDSAFKMLNEAKDKGLQTVHSQSEDLPFAEGVFDRIIMVDALHHVKNQQRTLNELWRLLASGGKVVIEEPDIHHFFVKIIAIGEKVLLMRSHFLSPQKISEMCRFDQRAFVEIHRHKGNAWVIVTKRV